MPLHSLHDHVLVRQNAARDKIAGGIIIPETAKEQPPEGDIVPPAMAFVAKTASFAQ